MALHRYVIGYDPTGARAEDLLLRLLDACRDVFVVSLLAAAALSLFATLRMAGRTFLPLVTLAIAWTVLLVAGSLLWAPREPLSASVPAVPEGQVIRAGEYRLYAPRTEGLRLNPLLVHEAGAQPGFELFSEATLDPGARSVIVAGRPDIAPDLSSVDASYPAMVTRPERLTPLLRDVGAVNAVLLPDGSAAPHSVLNAVALGVLLLACWTLARLTRWPLFNAALVFLAVRGALWLVGSIHGGSLSELVTAALDSSRLGMASAGALAFVAAIFFIVLVILPPFSSWKREVGHE